MQTNRGLSKHVCCIPINYRTQMLTAFSPVMIHSNLDGTVKKQTKLTTEIIKRIIMQPRIKKQTPSKTATACSVLSVTPSKQ